MADDQFLSFEDALDQLRLQEEELKRLVSEGEIRAFREGDTMKLRAQDVETLRSELTGDVDAGASEEIVFEDDVDMADEAGMATEEIADVETILQEDDDVEEIELEEEEAAPVTDTAVRKRPSRAAAAAAVEEDEVEPGWVKGFLVVTSVVMILGIPVVMAVANDQISGLARPIAQIFDFDKVLPGSN
ncbi:MAG: hypothetical protein MK297_13270 [Planctomycetes bacterium]|nr:hypothetical protein [Planctomycetota bacterium]